MKGETTADSEGVNMKRSATMQNAYQKWQQGSALRKKDRHLHRARSGDALYDARIMNHEKEPQGNDKPVTHKWLEIWDNEIVTYNSDRIHTWKCLMTCRGTACALTQLWWEMFWIFFLTSISLAGIMMYGRFYYPCEIYSDPVGSAYVCYTCSSPTSLGKQESEKKCVDGGGDWVFVDHQFGNIAMAVAEAQQYEKFVDYLKVLVAFFLGMYMSLCINRWWTLKTNGIMAIMNASQALTSILNAWKEYTAASCLSRWARLSLQLCFSYPGLDRDGILDELFEKKLLTEDEVSSFLSSDLGGLRARQQAELPWLWIYQMVIRLKDAGRAHNCALHYLLNLCKQGQEGAAYIDHHLATQLPLPYTHIIAVLVKVENAFIAVTGAFIILFNYYNQGAFLLCILSGFKVLIVTFLFNAALEICAQLANPMETDLIDFPRRAFDSAMESRHLAYTIIGRRQPAIIKRIIEEVPKQKDSTPKSRNAPHPGKPPRLNNDELSDDSGDSGGSGISNTFINKTGHKTTRDAEGTGRQGGARRRVRNNSE